MSVISARQGSPPRIYLSDHGRVAPEKRKPLSGTLLKVRRRKILRRQRRASMDYIRITEDNIDGDICCAMSGKQSLVRRMAQAAVCGGLVFSLEGARAKCFIEYIPAEYAWVPHSGGGYLYINCLWVSGSHERPATPMTYWRVHPGCQGAGAKGRCVPCPPKDGSVSFSPTRSIWHTRPSQRRIPLPAGINCCICLLFPVQSRRNSRTDAKQPHCGGERLRALLHGSVSLHLLGAESGGGGQGAIIFP